MTKDILIGSELMKFTGNAATTYRYKQLFHRDLMRSFMEKGQDIDTDMIMEMAFVMKNQAAGLTNEEFNALTESDYMEWLSGIEFMPLMQAAPEILGLWANTSKATAKSKKK